jgi:predicted N-acyltransferase
MPAVAMPNAGQMAKSSQVVVKTVSSLADIPAAAWDRLANPDPATHNPFVSHAFLRTLEAAGTVGGRSGWQPQHLIIEDGGALSGAMPLYIKTHSQGEYVFDHGWADAFERAGGNYYPKLQAAVPFTPVPGRRFLVPAGDGCEAAEKLLAQAAIEVAKALDVSSLHATFLTEGEWRRNAASGYLQRIGQQYHWHNQGVGSFDDFLASLASRKRKTVKRERAGALDGITIEWVSGSDLTEAHWDAFFEFYMDTGSRKWGRPYLNRRFFSMLGQAMPERCLLVMAKRAGRYIAGALNIIGGDCLYGRYWGAIEHRPFLHFEVCYHQAIEFAITHKLARVEAGAQGDHKLARGYLPVPTYSLHWIENASFRRAVTRFLDEERRHMAEQREMLAEYAPYRKVVEEQD